MDAHLSCPCGHRWPLPDADMRAGGASPLVCPVCGPVPEARLSAAGIPDPAADPCLGEHATVRLAAFLRGAREAPVVAGYEILGEVGRGGMGVVYQARQLKLNRVVALKMILDDCRDRPQEYARFLSEAEVIASLKHPNIVQIYEIGESDGRPFFSLEFVEGGSLAQRLRVAGPLPPRQAARLIADLARAVDVAHRQGVVHRDLKPANVLLAGAPDAPVRACAPKITDFGLARKRGDGARTTAGFVLGTPCYMSPEQAAGRAGEVGPATDVHALGAILYELLTGRPPFEGDTPLATMQRVLSEDPVAPSQLRRPAPADLETICLKCLRKEPHRRYAAAGALADDLERFLNGRPVQARPAAPIERLAKWTRRRPVAAAFVGVSLAALALLLAGGLWHTRQLQDALSAADRAPIDAQTQRDASLRAKGLAEARERLVREYVYAVQMRQAHQLWEHADLRQMRELLSPYAAPGDGDLRDFTWRYLWRLSHADQRTLEGHAADVYAAAYSPDGTTLATAGRDGTARLWDAATGRPLFVLSGHEEEVNSAAFSPDGAALATAGDDGGVILWDVGAGRERGRLREAGEALQTVAWSSDGRLLTAAGHDRRVYVWEADAGRALFALDGHGDQVESAAFAPGGHTLASGARDGSICIWDLDERRMVQTLNAGAAVQTVTWSRDGRRLAAACGDGAVRLWDADRWQAHPPILAHVGEAQGVAFSPDGATLATCGNDHLVRLWDAATGAPRNVLKGHGDRVWCVAFSPDGKTLASAGRDRTVKLWDPGLRQDWRTLPAEGAAISALAVGPVGDVIAVGRADGAVELRGANEGGPPEVLPRQTESPVVALTFSRDGRRLGVQAADATVVVWELDGRRPRVLRGPSAVGRGTLSFSADGGGVASQAADGSVWLWDAATGETLPSPAVAGQECTCLAFSPAKGLLAIALRDDYQVVVYDLGTREARWKARGHRAIVSCMAFAADGKTLVTGSADHTAKLWDVETGRERGGGLLGHADAVLAAAFHPGGKTVATGGADRIVKLWDAVTGQELATLPGHSGRVWAVAFTPDGDALISAGDGPGGDELRLWSAAAQSEPRP